MGVPASATVAARRRTNASLRMIMSSVSRRLIDDVAQRLAREIAANVIFQQLGMAGPEARRGGSQMRRDEHVRRLPQRTLRRQRLGLEDVRRRAGNSLAFERRYQRGVIDQL